MQDHTGGSPRKCPAFAASSGSRTMQASAPAWRSGRRRARLGSLPGVSCKVGSVACRRGRNSRGASAYAAGLRRRCCARNHRSAAPPLRRRSGATPALPRALHLGRSWGAPRACASGGVGSTPAFGARLGRWCWVLLGRSRQVTGPGPTASRRSGGPAPSAWPVWWAGGGPGGVALAAWRPGHNTTAMAMRSMIRCRQPQHIAAGSNSRTS